MRCIFLNKSINNESRGIFMEDQLDLNFHCPTGGCLSSTSLFLPFSSLFSGQQQMKQQQQSTNSWKQWKQMIFNKQENKSPNSNSEHISWFLTCPVCFAPKVSCYYFCIIFMSDGYVPAFCAGEWGMNTLCLIKIVINHNAFPSRNYCNW